MIDVQHNKKINNDLKKNYIENTATHLQTWKECYGEEAPSRINEFGIIDVERYDSVEGILVIGRETNGWSNNDYAKNDLFLPWIKNITKNGLSKEDGKVKKHPTTWYNIARYVMTVKGQKDQALSCDNEVLLSLLGTIAFTNVNKVRGGSKSSKAYWQMYKKEDVIKLIVEEIETIKPQHIILCDKFFAKFLTEENLMKLRIEKFSALKECLDNNRLYVVDHPAARISKEKMLNKLEEQIKGEKYYYETN